MKLKRNGVFILLVLVLAGMVLYAPYHIPIAGKASVDLGYGFVFDPPRKGPVQGVINTGRLLMQLGGTLAAGVVLLLITRK